MNYNPAARFANMQEVNSKVNLIFGLVLHDISQLENFKRFPMELLWWFSEKMFSDHGNAQRFLDLTTGNLDRLTGAWMNGLYKRTQERFKEVSNTPLTRILQDFNNAYKAPLHLHVAQILFTEEVFKLQARHPVDLEHGDHSAAERAGREEADKIMAPLNMGVMNLSEMLNNIDPLFAGMSYSNYAIPLPPDHPKSGSLSVAYAMTLAAYRLFKEHNPN